jgi:hypothetical protein
LPAEILSVDYQGTINPTSVRRYTGFFFFKDLFSGYRHAIFVKDKSGETFYQAAQEVITFYKSHGHSMRSIRCDAGSSKNDSVSGAKLLDLYGVTMQPAAPVISIRTPLSVRFKPWSKASVVCFSINSPLEPRGGITQLSHGSRPPTADLIRTNG